jgi:hypothetical protein
MIDLTSKTPEQINALIQKWLPALQESKVPVEHYLQIAYIFDIATPYIKEKYSDLTPEWKAWCMVVLRDLYKKNKINVDDDITNIIDDFFNDFNLNFESYCSYMVSASEYDQQRGFVHGYILKKGR